MIRTACKEGRGLRGVCSSAWVSGYSHMQVGHTRGVEQPLSIVVDPETWLIMQTCNKNCYMASPAVWQQFLGKALHCNFPCLKLSVYPKKFYILQSARLS